MVDHWEAGDDVMSSATFVNPDGCEIQLLCPLNDGPLGRRLEKRGEGVHHVCFTAPDLPAAVARLAARGVKLTSTVLSQDPARDWQAWTFITPESSHGPLVELAYPYRAVDGRWLPADGLRPRRLSGRLASVLVVVVDSGSATWGGIGGSGASSRR